MLSKEELQNSYIIVSNEEEYHILTKELINMGFENRSFKKNYQEMFKFAGWEDLQMIVILEENTLHWANHKGGKSKEILYSDIIKPNSLSLLESRLINLFLNPTICIRLDSIQDKIKMTKLMIQLDYFRWHSGISFKEQSIESISNNTYFIPFDDNKGSRLLPEPVNRKIIPFKDILKEIDLEELNNKNNNNN